MEAVADLANLVDPAGLQQLVVDQRVNQSLTSRRIEVENGRGHPGREVGPLQQAQPPERPLLPVGEGAVAEGDAGPDLQVAGGQLVQPPVFVGQPLGQPGQRPGRAGGQPGSGDPDGQRQPAAVADDGRRRIRFGGGPAGSGHPGKQLDGRLGRQDVQVDQSCPLQPGQAAPAGHQHPAARAPRQQGPHLGLAAGIVQHHQHPPVGQQHPVALSPLLEAVGNAAPIQAQSPQEPGQDRTRIQRVRLGALEVHIQLAVGELVSQSMGDVHGQGRLADPGFAGHRRDDDRVRAVEAARCQQLEDLGDLRLAAGEVGHRRGQQAWHRPLRSQPGPDPAGRRLQLVPVPAGQLQGVGQPPDGVLIGPADPAGLQVAQGPLAQPGPLRQLLLGERQPHAVRPQQPPEALLIEPGGLAGSPCHAASVFSSRRAPAESLQAANGTKRLVHHGVGPAGPMHVKGSVTELIPKSCRPVARDYRTWRVVRPKFAGKFAGALPGPGKAPRERRRWARLSETSCRTASQPIWPAAGHLPTAPPPHIVA